MARDVEDDNYIIYKITNLVNGKVYIGQTKKSLAIRFKQHCKSDSGCTLLKNAIKKYGRDNFHIEAIEHSSNDVLALERETYWINELDSLSPNGYNLRIVGKLSKYVGNKISKSLTGRRLTKQHKEKIVKNLTNASNELVKNKMVKTKRKKEVRNKDSGFKGVYWRANRNKWCARICLNGKDKHLGTFGTAEEAAQAYDSAAIKLYGKDCFINLPSEVCHERR